MTHKIIDFKVTSERWVRLNSKLHEYHNYLARRMVEGNRYQIRVTAVNDCGAGEPSANSETFMPLAPTSEVTQLRTGKLTGKLFYSSFLYLNIFR